LLGISETNQKDEDNEKKKNADANKMNVDEDEKNKDTNITDVSSNTMNVDEDTQNIDNNPVTSPASTQDKPEGASNNNDKQMKDEDTTKQDETNKKVIPKEEYLENPARVTPNQIKYSEWIDARYKPIKPQQRLFGVIIVKDTKPFEQKEIVEAKTLDASGVHGNEPKPPKPFTYLGD